MSELAAQLDSVVERIEHTEALDAPAAIVAPLVERMTRSDAVKRVLSGAPLGHRLHPALTDVPLGMWTAASTLDIIGGRASRTAARRLTGLGILAALPTAASGLSDWHDTERRARRVGVVHMAANSAALLLQISSWNARRRGHHIRGRMLGFVSMGALLGAGYLGGQLVYRNRVGVDPDVPVVEKPGWHVACRADDLVDGHPYGADVEGARVVLVRDLGRIVAMAAVCSHAGGPLDEGRLIGDRIECPWHGSQFCLADGSVSRGPAASPQPMYETRIHGDVIEVRRSEA